MFMEKNNEDLSCLRTHVLGAKSLLKNLGHLHLPEESQFSLVSPFVPGSLKEPGLQSITSRRQEGLRTVVFRCTLRNIHRLFTPHYQKMGGQRNIQ